MNRQTKRLKTKRLKLVTALLFNLCLLAWHSASFALDPNSTEAIEIESNSVTFDDKNGISSYSGNVIVKQGNSRLEADELIVFSENREISRIEASGSPAHFADTHTAIRALSNKAAQISETHGYAEKISYHANEATLVLKGKAKLSQNEHSFAGDQIVYDTKNKAIKAQGNESEGQRVHIQFKPPAPIPTEKTNDQPAENAELIRPAVTNENP